jgi:hypothetical protein
VRDINNITISQRPKKAKPRRGNSTGGGNSIAVQRFEPGNYNGREEIGEFVQEEF